LKSINVPLLKSLGVGPEEVQTYLKRYMELESGRFGVIKVGGGVILEDLDELTESISILTQFGLIPIVVHGAGPQMNSKLEQLGIQTIYDDGMRVTTAEVLKVARKIFVEANYTLTNALERKGCRAMPIQSGIFEAKPLNLERWGYVGEITSVNVEPIFTAIENGCVPVLTCMGQSDDGHFLNINADIAARDVAQVVQPKACVFISQKGGLFDAQGEIIQSIDIAYDYDNLMSRPWYSPGDGLKLKEIKSLMQVMPAGSVVSVTSAKMMAKELLTHSRCGTLVTHTERINKFDSLEKIDKPSLIHLLESTLEGKLRPDYFDDLKKKLKCIYLSELNHAVAIITEINGVPHMDKFVVTEEYQMAGLGRRIFSTLENDFPTLLWRSHNNNPINRWFFEHAQGSWRGKKWTVFWSGLGEYSEAEKLVEALTDFPNDITRKEDQKE